jgi:hypothetical protein
MPNRERFRANGKSKNWRPGVDKTENYVSLEHSEIPLWSRVRSRRCPTSANSIAPRAPMFAMFVKALSPAGTGFPSAG